MSKKTIAVVILGLSLCILGVYILLFYIGIIVPPINDFYLHHFDSQDPNSVAPAFSVALMENEEDVLRRVVVSDQWGAIETWLSTHESVHCKIPGDGSVGVFITGNLEGGNPRKYRSDGDIILTCPNFSGGYHLSVENLVLEYHQGEWKVVTWEVCEEAYAERSCP